MSFRRKLSVIIVLTIFGVAVPMFWLPQTPAKVHATFLTEAAALRDTVDILRGSECTQNAVGAFKRAVERYSSKGFNFDLSKFPRPRSGIYSFDSASGLVAALPHQLCDTPHAYEFNCFDTVITLADGLLSTSLRPDDLAGPFLVQYTPTTNSGSIVRKDTARDAFTLAYPQWYLAATDSAFPAVTRDARISLTAIMFRWHVLPPSTTEEALRSGVLEALRESWRHHDLKFPAGFEIVLCHEVSLQNRMFITAHAGLLFPHKNGYVYIEKSGGSGPFVRLDFEDRAELLIWLGGMFRGAEKLGYTHHFATFNDTKIEVLEFLQK